MSKNIYTFLLVALCAQFSQAQNPPLSPRALRYSPMNVERAGVNLPPNMVGMGGTETPQYSPIDLNNDGKKDLLVYDRTGKIALTYLNTGTAGNIEYTFAPEFMPNFPQNTSNFMLARDYNGDGIEDLFFFYQPPASSAGVGVWKGSYDTNSRIRFTMVKEVLLYDYPRYASTDQQMFVYNPDLPAISDMDGDGDLDIAAFSLDFTFSRNIFYYKNLSVERGFGRDSLIYSAVSDCFGQFSESGLNNTVILSGRTDSCGDNPWWRTPIVQGGSRHLGSSLTVQDLNGDNRPEILMGDVSVNALNAISTTRINDTLVGVSQDSTFPSYNTSVSLLSFPAAYFLDVNNDGKLDMIAATNEQAYSETVTDSTSWLYLNTGSNSNIQLSLHQKDFFYNQSLDFGHEAHPVVFDYNGDGLLDILVGNNYNTNNNRSVRAGFSLLLNVGTATQPRFRVDNSYLPSLSGITASLNSLYPTVGDLDADGDMDLVVGTGSAGLIYFRNSGGAGQPVQWSAPIVDYLGLSQNLGAYLAPQLFDLDRDGDLDLLLGENSGNLNYLQNTGTPQNPVFANTATDNLLGDISLYVGGSRRLVPFFTREQNTTQLYLGHEQGNVIQMGNIDNNLSGKFDTLNANFQNIYMGNYTALAMADLNGDTTLDMVLGNVRGGLSFFMSADTNHTVDIIDWSADLDNSILYPNPIIDRFTITFGRPSQGDVTFSFVTALGSVVYQQVRPGGRTQYNFNIESLKRGVYYLQSVRDRQQKTFMIIKR